MILINLKCTHIGHAFINTLANLYQPKNQLKLKSGIISNIVSNKHPIGRKNFNVNQGKSNVQVIYVSNKEHNVRITQ